MIVAVVGAGLSGLAAACELADLGHQVTVYEKRPWAGGKTYSVPDRETGEAVDNGQHVFMACTTEYVAFLRRLGTLGFTRRQRLLRVPVYDAGGRVSTLRAQRLPAPFHLALSFARYRHLSFRDKAATGRLLFRVWRMSEGDRRALAAVPFGDWLRAHGQSPAAIERFWDFMLVPTLNCRCGEASAADALFVLREGFLRFAGGSAIGVSSVGLSELHVDPAVAYLEKRGGAVVTGQPVRKVTFSAGRATGVTLTDGTNVKADAVVVGVPPHAVAGLLPARVAREATFAGLAAIPEAAIINLHFWFDRPVADFSFAAFLGNELQWVFNRDRLDRAPREGRHHVVVSLSAAAPYMALTKRELQERFLPQLFDALPATRDARLVKFAAMKEPGATFVPAPGLQRPSSTTSIPNLMLAGAYTDTGWPATMESAVRSGLTAARALHVHLASLQSSANQGLEGK